MKSEPIQRQLTKSNLIATSLSNIAIPFGIKMFFTTDVAIAFAYILNVIVGEPSQFLSRMFDLGGEVNLPTWYSSMKLFLIAVLLAFFAHHESKKSERAYWPLVLAVMVFLLLSLDEVAQIHEWLGGQIDKFVLPSGSRKTSVFPKTGVWMFALGPVFVGVLLSLGMSVRHYFVGRERIGRKYVVGMLVFVGSAAGTDIFLNFVSLNEMAYILQNVCEELGEMLGATILLWATWELLVSHRFVVSIGNDEYVKGKW